MKNLILIAIAICSFSISLADYKDNQITLKIKSQSPYLGFAKQGSSLFLADYRTLLGDVKIEPYLKSQTLRAIELFEQKRNKSQNLSGIAKDEPLERIFKLTFASAKDVMYIVNKLRSDENFEYVEPIPINKIIELPNDPELSKQYYLNGINAFQAWDSLNTKDSVLIGICDTGVDHLHPDLADKIHYNLAEMGKDSQGRDKSSNGIDDDNNGYVDDFRGFDLYGNENKTDNDATPANGHGMHVAGIVGATVNNAIGIAGVGINLKLLPIKVASDESSDNSVYNQYDGIIYGAIAGAKVINCSWGGSSQSKAEQEVIDKAMSFGSIVVAAAGNNGQNLAFYPASYTGVVSVASLDSGDKASGFTNYHGNVDIAAPGGNIFSTWLNNGYRYNSGTSMASPVVAAVVGMVSSKYPNLSNSQIVELVKVNSDKIDSLNDSRYAFKLGNGRVNALKALSGVGKSIRITEKIINEIVEDKIYESGEELQVSLKLKNILFDLKNVFIKIESINKSDVIIASDSISLGDFASSEEKTFNNLLNLKIASTIAENKNVELLMKLYSDNELINTDIASFIANPTYRNFFDNNIHTTINSRGNIGYNDYPNNAQGEGFEFKNSGNLLFEGALIVVTDTNKIYDVARGSFQGSQSKDFSSLSIISKSFTNQYTFGKTKFTTERNVQPLDSNRDILEIEKEVIQPTTENSKDLFFVKYTINNKSGRDIDSLFLGLYFDWDLGAGGSNNICKWDSLLNYGIVERVDDPSLPKIGVKLMTSELQNFYAINNDGTDSNDIGVYNGFTKKEKWFTTTQGIAKKETRVGDVSMVTSAGPIRAFKNEKKEVTFAIFSGENLEVLNTNSKRASLWAKDMGLGAGEPMDMPDKNLIRNIFPNPFSDSFRVLFDTKVEASVKYNIVDLSGRIIKRGSFNNLPKGYHYKQINLDNELSVGSYILQLDFNTERQSILIQKTQ